MDPTAYGYPPKQAMYDPAFEKEACGVGFVVSIDGIHSQKVDILSLQILPLDGDLHYVGFKELGSHLRKYLFLLSFEKIVKSHVHYRFLLMV